MDWSAQELSSLSLGDKRLDGRAEKLLSQLSHNSSDSIPVACRGAAEVKAAYRFFDHEQVTGEKIQQAHFDATFTRMKAQPIILLAQDTTVLNFTGQRQRADVGPTTKDSSKGMHLHCALAVTPEKVCLGVTSSKQWHRDALQMLTKAQRQYKNYHTPIEEKETYRWLENYRHANDCAAKLPDATIVSMADREGDIYDIYKEAHDVFTASAPKARYLIRAKADRKVCNKKGKRTGHKLKIALQEDAPLGHIDVNLSETRERKPRKASLSVYAKPLYIDVPDKWKKGKDYQPVQINAILCIEADPPKDGKAIEWLLITDIATHTFEQACEKIQWYTCRWQIELFFKVLKSGCTIEKLQLKDKNFSACLSFYMIIAWRLLYITLMGRHCPDTSCEAVFSSEEWQTTHVVVCRQTPPSTPPSLNTMVRMVASLGGYLNRKSDPEPGVKTLWIGIRNMQEHLKAREAYEAVYAKV